VFYFENQWILEKHILPEALNWKTGNEMGNVNHYRFIKMHTTN
jgi:hypothetical protein